VEKVYITSYIGGGGKEQSYPVWTEKAITHFFSKTRILKKVYIERKKEIAGTLQSHDDTFDTPLKVGAFTLGVVKKDSNVCVL